MYLQFSSTNIQLNCNPKTARRQQNHHDIREQLHSSKFIENNISTKAPNVKQAVNKTCLTEKFAQNKKLPTNGLTQFSETKKLREPNTFVLPAFLVTKEINCQSFDGKAKQNYRTLKLNNFISVDLQTQLYDS